MPRLGRNIDEDPGGRIIRKITGINGINGRKIFDRSTVNITFQDMIHIGACGFQAKLHLFQNEFGLPFNRRIHDFAGFRVKRRKAGNINRITSLGDRRSWRFPAFKVGGQRSTQIISRFIAFLDRLLNGFGIRARRAWPCSVHNESCPL